MLTESNKQLKMLFVSSRIIFYLWQKENFFPSLKICEYCNSDRCATCIKTTLFLFGHIAIVCLYLIEFVYVYGYTVVRHLDVVETSVFELLAGGIGLCLGIETNCKSVYPMHAYNSKSTTMILMGFEKFWWNKCGISLVLFEFDWGPY